MERIIDLNAPLTSEQVSRLDSLALISDDEIIYDEDAPKLTEDQLKQFKRVYPQHENLAS